MDRYDEENSNFMCQESWEEHMEDDNHSLMFQDVFYCLGVGEEQDPEKALINSTGTGKMIVEFFSAEIDWRVWRYLNCRAAGESIIIWEASLRARADFCSPSAAMTFARASRAASASAAIALCSWIGNLTSFLWWKRKIYAQKVTRDKLPDVRKKRQIQEEAANSMCKAVEKTKEYTLWPKNERTSEKRSLLGHQRQDDIIIKRK